MRDHNNNNSKDQFPWFFNDTKNISNNSNYDTIKIIRDDINLRYSLLNVFTIIFNIIKRKRKFL